MSEKFKELVGLEAKIRFHDYRYSVLNAPMITNTEYDELVARYYKLVEQQPNFVPRYTPGFIDQPEGFKTIKIIEPMISIVKKQTQEDFLAWIKKNGGENPVHEEKMDGVPIRLGYESGRLVNGHLRGSETLEGIDVTHRLHLVKNIPAFVEEFKDIPFTTVDGEVFCMYEDLYHYADEWDKPRDAIEARSTVGGMLKRLEQSDRDTLKMYYRVHGAGKSLRDGFETWRELKAHLAACGFDVVEELVGELLANLFYLKEKPNFGYPIDGIVVRVNDLSKWNDTKMVGYYSYAACYKFPTSLLETKIKSVTWGLTTQGELTGRLNYEPVQYDGTTLQRCKFDYADQYIKNGIRIGSIIQVTKSNEIIPNLVGVKELGNGRRIFFPKTCPMCDDPIVKETEAVYRCVNARCVGLIQKQLERLVGNSGLKIKGLGPQGIRSLIDQGYLSNPQDIFNLTYENLINVEIDQNRATSIIEQIQQTKDLSLDHWLFAACIPEIGIGAAAELAAQQGVLYQDLPTLIEVLKSSTTLCELFGIVGLSMAEYVNKNEATLFEFFVHYNFDNKVEEAKELIPIVFTGSWIIPRNEIEERLEVLGYSLSERVTKKVTKLFVGDSPSPTKINKATDYGIPIIYVSKTTGFDKFIGLLKQ
jgi:DNA ligase (NAD+)